MDRVFDLLTRTSVGGPAMDCLSVVDVREKGEGRGGNYEEMHSNQAAECYGKLAVGP